MDAPFTSKQRVNWDMLDLMGVLHNAAYLLLFERARTELWRSLGAKYGSDGFDWPYLVVRNEVNYRAPIESDQLVDVTVGVSKLGRTSITWGKRPSSPLLCPMGKCAFFYGFAIGNLTGRISICSRTSYLCRRGHGWTAS